MKSRVWMGTVVGTALLIVGCATQPPRTGNFPATTTEQEQTVASGGITVSPLQFKPITAESAKKGRVEFGDLKDIKAIRDSIRAANMGIDQLSYQALSASIALSLAGQQIYANNLLSGGGGGSGGLDLGALSGLLSGAQPGANPLTGEVNLGVKNEATYQRTFTSPEKPEAPPATPKLPESVATKLIDLLGRSASTFTLDPQKEIALIAAYRTYMEAVESFYDPQSLAELESLASGSTSSDHQKYLPYRMEFSVSVDPGWYSYLEQYDGVVEIPLELPSGGKLDEAVILNVVPSETAQTIDEMSAAMQQLALAAQAGGAFSAVAFNSAADSLIATSNRLQGFRKNTTTLVSYPSSNKIRIRIRPSVVANNHLAETQHSNYIFAATVLLKKRETTQSEPQETPPPVAPGFQPQAMPPAILELTGETGSPSETSLPRQTWDVSYCSWFERQVELRRKRGPGDNNIYYHSPGKYRDHGEPLQIGHCSQTTKALVAPYPKEKTKPFGFTGNVFGFYDMGDKCVTAYLTYQLSNPEDGKVDFTASGGTVVPSEVSTGKKLVGMVTVSGIPAPPEDGMPIRLMFGAKDIKGNAVVQEVVIPARYQMPASGNPVITVNRSGVAISPTELNKIDTDKLKAILGNQIWLAQPSN